MFECQWTHRSIKVNTIKETSGTVFSRGPANEAGLENLRTFGVYKSWSTRILWWPPSPKTTKSKGHQNLGDKRVIPWVFLLQTQVSLVDGNGRMSHTVVLCIVQPCPITCSLHTHKVLNWRWISVSRKRFSPSHGGGCFQRGSTCHTNSAPSRYTKSSLDVVSTIGRTRFTLADSNRSSRYPVSRLFDSPMYWHLSTRHFVLF
jgi:hypothetical protein